MYTNKAEKILLDLMTFTAQQLRAFIESEYDEPTDAEATEGELRLLRELGLLDAEGAEQERRT